MEGASTCNDIQRLPSQAKRTENARFEAGGGKNANGTRMSRRPDGKARKRMQAEGRNINSNKTAGHVPGHQINQRWDPVVAPPLYDATPCCSAKQRVILGTREDISCRRSVPGLLQPDVALHRQQAARV